MSESTAVLVVFCTLLLAIVAILVTTLSEER